MIRALRRLPLACLALAAACMPCRIQAPQAAPLLHSGMFTQGADEPPSAIAEAAADTARIVEVRILTTNGGASGDFAPRVVRARQGDVLRFRMADGLSIHNVSFASFANDTRGVPLPLNGPYLTREGQSWQMRIDLPPGTYEFACLPHAQDGHRATLVVEP